MPSDAPEPIVCLLGPTASGKTALSLALADALDAEIVSVDSALVYRGLDIGSAKPSADERARVPHHLIDRVDPDEPYSAARFVEDALAAIADIRSRGRRVVLCGGTVLYVKALFDGLAELPPADPVLRRRLLERAATDGWPALHAELRARDPASAARLHPNDRQRVQRALEVVMLTGRSLSEWHGSTVPALDEPKVLLALLPTDRAWLHERIARRLDAMRRDGFDDEVRALAARGLSAELPALRSVGYRQALEALAAGSFERAADGGPPDWPARAIAATRQLAKRQLTWLRGMPGIVPIACDTLSLEAQLDLALAHSRPSP